MSLIGESPNRRNLGVEGPRNGLETERDIMCHANAPKTSTANRQNLVVTGPKKWPRNEA